MSEYVIECDHNVMCQPNCPFHCGKVLGAKTLNQVMMLKHIHISDNETHEVDIRDDKGGLVKIE